MLPTSRNTNYSQGANVKSADLNDLQDQVIANARGRRVSHKVPIPLSLFIVDAGSEGSPGIKRKSGNLGYISGDGGGTLGASLPFEFGTKITELLIYVRTKGSTGDLDFEFYSKARTDSLLSQNLEGSVTVTGTGEAVISGLNVVMSEDSAYYITIGMPDESIDIDYCEATIEVP